MHNLNLHFTQKTSEVSIIEKHLLSCDDFFVPALRERVSIHEYSEKIYRFAETFEAWIDDSLVGLLAIYMNQDRVAYITSVSVLNAYSGNGIASRLVNDCISACKDMGFKEIRLEVGNLNYVAIKLYDTKGFKLFSQTGDSFIMRKILN